MFQAFVNVQELVLNILAIAVILIGLGVVYALVMSIFHFIFSAGNDEKIKKAGNGIRYLIIGVLLTLIFLYPMPIVFTKLRVTGYENLTAGAIFTRAIDIIQLIFSMGSDFDWSSYDPAGSSDGLLPGTDDTIYTL